MYIVCSRTPHPFCWEVGVEPPTQFSEGGRWEQGGELFQEVIYINNLNSEIFNDKKGLLTKMFFSVITKNSNQEMLTKNFVTFKK